MSTRIVGLDQARRQLSELVNGMERSGLRYLVSSRGKPKAVLMGVSDYLMTVLKQKRASIVAEIQLEAKAKGLDKLPAAAIEREIRAVRRRRQ